VSLPGRKLPGKNKETHMTKRVLSRRSLLQTAVSAGLAGITSYAAPRRKPNILFILADDLGPRELGCYGSKVIRTPNIDHLAAQGMQFTQAYAGCTVCAPSRSTLMTGRHMGHTSVRGNSGGTPLLAEDITVTQLLKQARYATGGFGKWGLGDVYTTGVPEKHGFDRFVGYYHQVHAHYYYPNYLIDTGKKLPLPGNAGFNQRRPVEFAVADKDPDTGVPREFSAYRIFDEMKRFIRDNRSRPFFCYAPWTLPHGRYQLPADDSAWLEYKDKPWSLPAKGHAAFCSMVDRFVGETLALVKQLGIERDTIVFFCSDNGAPERFEGELDSCGELRGKKTNLYEGGIRVPWIVRWPGRIQARAISNRPVYFPDFLPTAAQIAGGSTRLPSGVDGISLVDELTGKSRPGPDRHLYWEWNGRDFDPDLTARLKACRYGRWKLVRHDPKAAWELYDLATDASERHDVSATHPQIVADLSAWITANRTDARPQQEPRAPGGRDWA